MHGINGAKFEIFVAGLKAHQSHQRGAQAIDLDKSDFRIDNLASLLDEHGIGAVCDGCGYLVRARAKPDVGVALAHVFTLKRKALHGADARFI